MVVGFKEGTEYCSTHSVDAGMISSHCEDMHTQSVNELYYAGIDAVTSDPGVFEAGWFTVGFVNKFLYLE